jgi:arylsulfatase
MVDTPKRPFDEDIWEVYDHAADWSQAHDLAAEHPDKLRELQEIFQREAERFHVLPLDDRVTERENPDVAGRLDLHLGRSSLSFGPRVGRLSEEAAPNIKNRSHVITADLELVTGTNGVVVAQGGRFGGWSLYVVGGVPHYAYNHVGRALTVVRGGKPMVPGRHDLVVRFAYDGGPPGSGADVSLEVDGATVGSGRIPETTAYYFSFDETFNVGVDRGTPVVDDYLPVRNRFEGLIHRVRFDLDEVADPGTDEGHERAVMVHQ